MQVVVISSVHLVVKLSAAKKPLSVYIYIYIYIYTDKIAVLHVGVGLAQARPN